MIFLCTNLGFTPFYAYAHFFGDTKNVDGYQIVFQPYPSIPFAGDNSTRLNLSILDKDNQNVNNIFASLTIKEQSNGTEVQNFPYKFYEFSDLTFPYIFKNIGDYIITINVRINGDPVYQNTPLSASFNLSVSNPNQVIPIDELIIYYVLPTLVAIAGIVVYLIKKNRI